MRHRDNGARRAGFRGECRGRNVGRNCGRKVRGNSGGSAGGGGDAEDGVQVDGLLNLGIEGVVPLGGHGAFHGGNEAEMAFRLGQVVAAGEPADDGEAGGGFNLGLAEFQVAGAAHAVEDDAGDAEGRVKLLVAEDFGGHAAGDLAGVGNQDDGGVQELGEFGGGAVLVQGGVAVVEAHYAFDDGEVGAGGGAVEQFDGHRVGQQPGVQVAGGYAAGEAVVGGVDVIGAGFEGLDAAAAAGPGRP